MNISEQHGCNRGEIDMSKEEKFWRACSMLSYVIAIFIGIASYISNNTVTSVALLWYIAGCKCELNSNFYAIERLNKVNNKVD